MRDEVIAKIACPHCGMATPVRMYLDHIRHLPAEGEPVCTLTLTPPPHPPPPPQPLPPPAPPPVVETQAPVARSVVSRPVALPKPAKKKPSKKR